MSALKFIRYMLGPAHLDHDPDTPLAEAEADREDWAPGELPGIPEPALSNSELVAVRQLIEERFGDRTGADLPAEWLPDVLADTAATILDVLRNHHAITYHAGITDIVEACECSAHTSRAMDRDTWARHVLSELIKAFPSADPRRERSGARNSGASAARPDHPTK